MKKLSFMLILTCLPVFLMGQKLKLIGGDECENTDMIVELVKDNGDQYTITEFETMVSDFFGSCYDANEANPMVNLYLKWEISYALTDGSYYSTPSADSYIPVTNNNSFQITINTSPIKWVNPGNLTVKLKSYEYDTNENKYNLCNSESKTYTPKKDFISNWTCTIDAQTNYTFLVSDVPGVNYNWTYPVNWTIVSGLNSNEITLYPESNAQEGTISVTTNPALDACGYDQASCTIKITDCFYNGETNYSFCTPNNWTTSLTNAVYSNKDLYPRFFGDFNGDDKTDIIGFGDNQVEVGVSTGSSFTVSGWTQDFTYVAGGGWNQTEFPRQIGDFNGDGKDDIVGFGNLATSVGLSNGTSFVTSQWHSGFDYSAGYTDRNVVQRLIGDFNGDGKDDIIGLGYVGNAVGISTGSSFISSSWSGANAFTAVTGGMDDMNTKPKKVGDFNGDGKDDIIGFRNNDVLVGLSTGSSFSNSVWTTGFTYLGSGYEESTYPRMIGDFNGDGKDDIIGFGYDAIAVGLSTGSTFAISTWLSKQEFSKTGVNQGNPDDDWIVDNREIGVVSIQEFIGAHELVIIDMNNDGKDDIVGFGEDGVYVSYSSGDRFQCPVQYVGYGNNVGYDSENYVRSVGNFDNTDDEPEIIGLGYSAVSVMNCNNCPNPIASAYFPNPESTTSESGYNGWTVNVNNFCEGDQLIIDPSSSQCEDRYRYYIYELDINNWTTNLVYSSTDWVVGNVPNSIDISNDVNWTTGQLYMISFAVGPTFDSEELWFRVNNTSAYYTQNSTSYQESILGGLAYQTVYTYCSGLTSLPIFDGSHCYDAYRIEIHATDPYDLSPVGPTLYSIPSWPGLNPGLLPNPMNVNISSLSLNQIYELKLSVKRGSTTETYVAYFKRILCRSSSSNNLTGLNAEKIKFSLYPNPTTGQFTIELENFEFESQVELKLVSVDGKLILNQQLSTPKTELDIVDLESGIYFVIIQHGDQTLKRKLIKH